jgi:hypothetical protein
MFAQIKIVIFTCALLLSAFGGWYVEHCRFIAFEEKVSAIGKEQEIKNEQIVKEQKQVTEGITNDYKSKLATIKRYYAGKLFDNSSSSKMPIISCATAGVNEGTTDKVLATEVSQLPEQCAETTQQLLSLQSWIQQQANK